MRLRPALGGALLAMLGMFGLGLGAPPVALSPAGHAGAQACANCHQAEAGDWRRSHHALAMQPATPATVLGDFNGAAFEHAGVATRFRRDGDRFLVRTDGPDGTLHEYEVAWVFGVDPLQQYLIAQPGGRLQALGIAWDARPLQQGGQRWFHLYPDQQLRPGDRLHWTGRDQTWNQMCADCHSTALSRNFDLAGNSYATTWAEANVACEACHGAGGGHVAWATAPAGRQAADLRRGITAWLRATESGHWEMDETTGIARRTAPLVSAELDTCAGCHARRKQIAADPAPGGRFLDSYLPALLEPGLYHADGQIDGEVFEYGSFLQSRMHRAGVTCSDCHLPHSATLRAEGNAVCSQCHLPARFEAASHHHHPAGSAGAQCANCHMPQKTYMGVDVRHDHSFRVPRPDLSVAIGVPNSCTTCHADRDAAWAAQAVAGWFPNGRQTTPHYGLALHAGRTGAANAGPLLAALIGDRDQPPIARATALMLLQRHLSSATVGAVQAALADPEPLVRMAAPRGLPAPLSPPMIQALAPLLSDPVRAVRIEAARALAGADPRILGTADADALARAERELTAAEMVDADLPETHVNLGLLQLRHRDILAADAAYRTALRLDPRFVPALVNLADLERLRGREAESLALLRQAVALEPGNADVRYALGLALVRRREMPAALAELQAASDLAPDNGRYQYVYAIALNSSGNRDQAVLRLQALHRRDPANRDALVALMTMARDAGQGAQAIGYASALVALEPANQQYRAALAELQRRWPDARPAPARP